MPGSGLGPESPRRDLLQPPAPRHPGGRRPPGELEAEVLSVMWLAPGPVAASWVQQRLGGDYAYTTVVTILTRLHAKGVLTRARTGRSYAYTPLSDEAGLAARRMRTALDESGDRTAVLASFVSDLSKEDERLLRGLLAGADAVPVAPAAPDRGA